jgi:Flp pilus assembly protein TadG
MISGLNKDAQGQALVEFALILVVLLTMILAFVAGNWRLENSG